MTARRLLIMLTALCVVSAGFYAFLRATIPTRRGPAGGGVQSSEMREREIRDEAISRTVEKERRLRHALQPGDFDGAVQLYAVRKIMLIFQVDRDGTQRSAISEDPELQRILRLCRKWARTDAQRQLAGSLARGLDQLPPAK